MYINTHLSVNVNSHVVSVGECDRPELGDYQFLVVQNGSITISYPKTGVRYVLQKNDVILLDPVTPFTCGSLASNTVIGVRFDALFIDSLIPFNCQLICNSSAHPDMDYSALVDMLLQIGSAFFSKEDRHKMISLVYALADTLQNNYMVEISSSYSDSELRAQERLDHIMDFLATHYNQSLALGQLAEEMYLTPQYLSRFIKSHLHTNFTSLLTNIRLEHAYNELLHSDDSITNIALNNGFPNIAAFNKVFRAKYEMSPGSYRQKYHREESNSFADEPAPFDLELPSDSSASIQNVHIESLRTMPYRTPWCDTLNIGHLSIALKNSFHENMLTYHSYVPVRYVRFHGLFSEEILPYDAETKEFNFSNLDVIMNFFYNNSIIPFVELSRKPNNGYVTPPAFADDQTGDADAGDDYYYNALTHVLRHCLRTYGHAYMRQWRFEVWYRADERLSPTETPQAYAQRYRHFSHIIKSMFPTCMVGGPGYNMCGDFTCFTEFLTYMAKEEIAFDFLSVSAFSYEVQSQYKNDELTTIGIISPDGDHILNTFAMYHHYIRVSYYHTTPVYITEFGSTLSLHNHIYESVFQAAFLCKNMLGLLNHCECIAYNYFFDSSSPSGQPSLRNNISYLGLVCETGVPKPSLHAYHFLSMLGKNLIAQGTNYIITSSSDTRYQLLCFHYAHFNRNFCFNSWDNIRMENTYDLFEEDAPYQMHFTCNCMPTGRYKVTQLSLNRGYGSALDKYLRILEKGNLTSNELLTTILTLREDEVDYYKRTSIPRQDIYYTTCEDTMTLDCHLGAHEIVFFELSKIL